MMRFTDQIPATVNFAASCRVTWQLIDGQCERLEEFEAAAIETSELLYERGDMFVD